VGDRRSRAPVSDVGRALNRAPPRRLPLGTLMHYVAKIHPSGKRWRAEFPDIPGCAVVAATEDEAVVAAQRALAALLQVVLTGPGLAPRRRYSGPGSPVASSPSYRLANASSRSRASGRSQPLARCSRFERQAARAPVAGAHVDQDHGRDVAPPAGPPKVARVPGMGETPSRPCFPFLTGL
jgi:predicted RNase H-like HicB family nuclease